MSNKDKVFIFDTTMRDGEQSPGASMSLEEKIQISRIFDELGIGSSELIDVLIVITNCQNGKFFTGLEFILCSESSGNGGNEVVLI